MFYERLSRSVLRRVLVGGSGVAAEDEARACGRPWPSGRSVPPYSERRRPGDGRKGQARHQGRFQRAA
eukprot:7575112-Lingulodinium_polyedra.AAC.1